MKVFIWRHASNVTSNYHDGGGVVVLASSLDEARKLLPTAAGDGVRADCSAYTDKPDIILDVETPFAISFQDAGCC